MCLMRCLRSAQAVLFNISPIAAYKATGFVNHTPTFLYLGTNLYLRKFWCFWPKILQVHICTQVQDWFTKSVTVVSCAARGEMAARQRLLSADRTQVTLRLHQSHKLLYWGKDNTDFSFKSSICWIYNNFTNLCPYSKSTFARGRPDV